jgi:hypothetical protein
MTKLSSLTELRMNDQVVRALPKDLGRLRRLQVLEVRDNLLQEIPESIGECRQLRFIDLKANELRNLPETFNNLDSLRTLNLSFNIDLSGLTIVPSLRGCASLEKLDITFTGRISKEELARIRERGFATNEGESVSGVRTVGCPVMVDGHVIAAVTITGSEHIMDEDRLTRELSKRALEASNEIEMAITDIDASNLV